jgi:hypothetical protein
MFCAVLMLVKYVVYRMKTKTLLVVEMDYRRRRERKIKKDKISNHVAVEKWVLESLFWTT